MQIDISAKFIKTISWFLLPQLFNVALGYLIFHEMGKIWLAGVLFVLSSIVLLAATSRWYDKQVFGNFLSELTLYWQRFIESAVPSADIPSIELFEPNSPYLIETSTECLVENVRGGICFFFPSCEEEMVTVFCRSLRPYFPSFGKRSSALLGLKMRIPIMLSVTSQSGPDDALRHQVSEMLGEPNGSESVANVCRKLKSFNDSLVLFVDATARSRKEVLGWVGSPSPAWISKLIIAVSPEIEWPLKLSSQSKITLVKLKRLHSDSGTIENVSREIEIKIAELADEINLTATECRTRLHDLATAFLLAAMNSNGRDSYFVNEIQQYDIDFEKIIDHLPDWINTTVNGPKRTFAWKKEYQVLRDYLVAVQLFQPITELDENFLRFLNDSPACPYVRACLDQFDRDSSSPEHVLADFQPTSAHLVISKAWEPVPSVDELTIRALEQASSTVPPSYLDPMDLLRLLPNLIQIGELENLRDLLKSIPSAARASTILCSDASGEKLAIGIDLLLSDEDLWNYFEDGGSISEDLISSLSCLSDITTIFRLTTLLSLAPHGNVLPDSTIPIIRHCAKWKQWPQMSFSWLSPDDSEIDLIVERIVDVAARLGEERNYWMNGIKERCAFQLGVRLDAEITCSSHK